MDEEVEEVALGEKGFSGSDDDEQLGVDSSWQHTDFDSMQEADDVEPPAEQEDDFDFEGSFPEDGVLESVYKSVYKSTAEASGSFAPMFDDPEAEWEHTTRMATLAGNMVETSLKEAYTYAKCPSMSKELFDAFRATTVSSADDATSPSANSASPRPRAQQQQQPTTPKSANRLNKSLTKAEHVPVPSMKASPFQQRKDDPFMEPEQTRYVLIILLLSPPRHPSQYVHMCPRAGHYVLLMSLIMYAADGNHNSCKCSLLWRSNPCSFVNATTVQIALQILSRRT